MDLGHLKRSVSRIFRSSRSKQKPSSSPDPSSPAKEGTGERIVEPSKKRGREQEGETSGRRRAKSKGGRDEDEESNVDDRSSAKMGPSPSKKKGAARGSDGEKPERAVAREGQEKRTSSGRKTEMVHSPSLAPEVTPTKTETSGSATKGLEMAREGEEEKGEKSKGDDESIMPLPSEKPMPPPPNEDSPTTPVTSGAEVSQRQGEGGVDMNGGRNIATILSRSPLSSSTSVPGGSNNESKSIGVRDEQGGHEGGGRKLGMMSSPHLESDKEETERMREEEQGDKRSYSELSPTTTISSSPLPTIANEEMRARSGIEVSERQGGEGEDMNGGKSTAITSSTSPSLVSISVQGGSNDKELERIGTSDERARHESGEKMVGTMSSSPMLETTLAKREILESDKEEKERTREDQEQRGQRSYSEESSPTTTISSSPLPTIASEEMRARSGVEVSERQGGEGEDMNGGKSTVITSATSPSLVSTSVQGASNDKELERIGTSDERARPESGEKMVGTMSSSPMLETTLAKREILESDKEEEETTREDQEQRGQRSYSEESSPTTTISSSPLPTIASEEMRARSGVEVSERQGGEGEDMNGGKSTVITSATSPSLVSTSVQGASNDKELERIGTSDERARPESGEKMVGTMSSSPMLKTTLAKREILESDKEEKETTREDQEQRGQRSYSEESSPTTTISSSSLPTIANEEMRTSSGVEVSERQGGEGEDMNGGKSTVITSPLSPSLLSTSLSVGGNKEEPESIKTREEQGEDESGEKNVGMTTAHPTTETTSTKTEILETAEEDTKGPREEQGQSKRSHPIEDSPTSSSRLMPMPVNGKTELGDQKWSPTTGPTIANEEVTTTEPKRSHESLVGGGNDEEPESINARGGQGEYMNGKGKMGMVPIPSPILETTRSERKVSGREEIESMREGQVEGDETSNQERRDDDRSVPSTSSMFESVKEETRVEKPKRKEEEGQRGAYNGWKAGVAFGIIAVVGTIAWIGSTLLLKRRENNVRSRRTRHRYD